MRNEKDDDAPGKKSAEEAFIGLSMRVAQAILVAVSLGIGTWMITMDRSQQEVLGAIALQTKQLEQLSKGIEALVALDKRVAHIESTRFSRDDANKFEQRLNLLEIRCNELEKSKR